MLALVPLALVLAGARTVDHFPVANGVGAAAVNVSDGRLDAFRPQIFQSLDDGIATPQLLFDAYFGAQGAGVSTWLTDVAVDDVAALDDADAVRVTQRVVSGGNSVRLEVTWLSPFGLARPAVIAVVTATNEGGSAANVRFPSIANFHVGGGADNTTSESATYDPARDAVVETGVRGSVIAWALSPSVNHTMTPSDPFPLVQSGAALPTVDASGVRDNVVHGFTFAPANGSLAPGASYTFGVLYASTTPTSPSGSIAALESDIAAFIAGRSAQQILDDELAASRAFVASATLPAGMSADERALFGHSLALLRAAQVRAAVDVDNAGAIRRRPVGQIVASLPPGEWNIAWVRDASYATEALLAAGKHDEAARALTFSLDGDADHYASFVGHDYLVSVVRAFGGGGEESDTNASGPNIEYDDFGLFLHAYARALDAAALDDTALDDVKTGVADVLVALVDPGTGLLTADSSIWETHWDPSADSVGRRQYAYSSACASAGLRAFADALDARGDVDAAGYRAAADGISSAIPAHLVDENGALAGSVDELAGDAHLDAAAVEALNKDVLAGVDVTGSIARATMAAMAALRSSTTPGYFRNDEGGDYDSAEWLVVDMWLSRAFRRTGDVAEADRLLAHVTSTGADNLGEIPELLRTDASLGPVGAADGAIPMMGFGAGAYIDALFDRAHDLGLDAGEGEGASEGEGAASEGEGAASSEGEGASSSEGEGASSEGEGAASSEGEGAAEGEGAREVEGCTCASTSTAPLFVVLAAIALGRRRRC